MKRLFSLGLLRLLSQFKLTISSGETATSSYRRVLSFERKRSAGCFGPGEVPIDRVTFEMCARGNWRVASQFVAAAYCEWIGVTCQRIRMKIIATGLMAGFPSCGSSLHFQWCIENSWLSSRRLVDWGRWLGRGTTSDLRKGKGKCL